MKRIGNSKEPTIQRMLDIVSNLRDKFQKYTSLQPWVRVYVDNPNHTITYQLYIEDRECKELKTWPELLARYRELMND